MLVSRTGVSRPSRVRTSSPSTYTFTNARISPSPYTRVPSAGRRFDEVLEQLAHVLAGGLDLAGAAGLLAEDRWDANEAHRAQNST